MPLIAREVFLVDQKVMISVKLPKTAIEYIEVLIGEELPHFVDIFLSSDHEKSVFQCGPLKVPEIDLAIIVHVNLIKDSHYNCVSIAVLEFRRLLQEF